MLSSDQIVELLKTASGYDGRKPNPQAKIAWIEAARRGRWTFDDAVNAIHSHYAESREWIMPGDILARVRILRRERADAAEAERERSRAAHVDPAGRERVLALVSRFADQHGIPTDPTHDEARRSRPCPWCGSARGIRCVNPANGKPLREAAGHDARLDP